MKQILLIILMLAALSNIYAQEEEEVVVVEETTSPTISLSGSVDAYFRQNLGGDFDAAPGTSFANLPGFALGMANLIGTVETGKVGFVADLVYGPRGEDATFASPFLRPGGSSNIVNQMYAYWNLSDKTTVTIGNFNTFLGYEVISPTGNFNYSTSYMFSYGPFSHTGLKFDFDLGGGFSIMTGIFNPTDATEYNPTNKYVGGAQLGYDFGSGSAYLNTLFDGDFFQIDLTAGVDLSETLYLGVNATSASDNFSGAALYLQAATSDAFKIGLRGEYFKDSGVGVIGDGENVFDLTITGNYVIDGLTIMPEIRLDAFSSDIIPDGDDMKGSLSSFVLAVAYAF
ncbi:MAG: hypothetical protein ACJA01_004200 [Saprospiraceae bacterium]|jgi:hypothetical protein